MLALEREPRRIEGLDIANLQGDQAVGAIVAFVDGIPLKSAYRNYRIQRVEGIDDYAMVAEVVARRLASGGWPDLLLIDGGRGQLAMARRALAEASSELRDSPAQRAPEVVSLAKADEARGQKADKIYLPGRKNPLVLRPDHAVLQFLMRIRTRLTAGRPVTTSGCGGGIS